MRRMYCVAFVTLFPACGTDARLWYIGCRLRRLDPARSGRGADPRGEFRRRVRHSTGQRALRVRPTRATLAAAAAGPPPEPPVGKPRPAFLPPGARGAVARLGICAAGCSAWRRRESNPPPLPCSSWRYTFTLPRRSLFWMATTRRRVKLPPVRAASSTRTAQLGRRSRFFRSSGSHMSTSMDSSSGMSSPTRDRTTLATVSA
jgi:hypothetical protein